MSVVIVGGNECMSRRYIELCKSYNCKAKVYPLMKGEMRDFGTPDLLVLFTGTVSHKMVHCAMSKTRGKDTRVVRCHSASVTALKSIMDEHCAQEA
ncbi:MAG: DUF2325 domain-containing protein [Clostridia bacterium]|nr:DUF2325 domain-containing protein [Clostridia bacterium]